MFQSSCSSCWDQYSILIIILKYFCQRWWEIFYPSHVVLPSPNGKLPASCLCERSPRYFFSVYFSHSLSIFSPCLQGKTLVGATIESSLSDEHHQRTANCFSSFVHLYQIVYSNERASFDELICARDG